MKKMNVEQMENLQGGISAGCVLGIAGAALFLASCFAVPGAAIGIYVANAILGPTVSGLSVAVGCS